MSLTLVTLNQESFLAFIFLFVLPNLTRCVTERVNARPHECKTCGKRFTLLENLNRHQMIHTNQRPFHCPYCSKSFRLSQHLKEHIRIHTGKSNI